MKFKMLLKAYLHTWYRPSFFQKTVIQMTFKLFIKCLICVHIFTYAVVTLGVVLVSSE